MNDHDFESIQSTSSAVSEFVIDWLTKITCSCYEYNLYLSNQKQYLQYKGIDSLQGIIRCVIQLSGTHNMALHFRKMLPKMIKFTCFGRRDSDNQSN